jgi:hypothetical protein
MASKQRRPFLTVDDVTKIWGEERAAKKGLPISEANPMSRLTVYANLKASRPGGRYENNPVPTPAYPNEELNPHGQHPIWVPAEGETIEDVEQQLRDWYHNRPGPGYRSDLKEPSS